jgi:hypothetical protein
MIMPESSEFHGLEYKIPVYPLYLKNAKTSIANLTYRSHCPHRAVAIIWDSRKSWVYHIWTSPRQMVRSPDHYSDIQTEPDRIHGPRLPIQIMKSSFELAGVERELEEECCKRTYWNRIGL